MYDVITIGGATLDVLIHCPEMEHMDINGQKKIVFPHGQKMEIDSSLFETGGGGTNTATTFSRQNLKTGIVAKIGADFPAAKVISKLQEENVDITYLIQDQNDTTDFSTIIWNPKAGSTIFVNRGKGKLESGDIEWESLGSRWFYLASIEGNLEIVQAVDRICHPHNAEIPKIAWNPGKRELEKKDLLMSILPCIELFILNRTEAASLLNLPWDQNESILEGIQALPSKRKLITDGSRGAYYHNGKNWIWADIFPVETVDPTGAGDAYGSAFVAGLAKNLPEDMCLKRAAANAASVVGYPGAKEGILRENQIEEWMKKELEVKVL